MVVVPGTDVDRPFAIGRVLVSLYERAFVVHDGEDVVVGMLQRGEGVVLPGITSGLLDEGQRHGSQLLLESGYDDTGDLEVCHNRHVFRHVFRQVEPVVVHLEQSS